MCRVLHGSTATNAWLATFAYSFAQVESHLTRPGLLSLGSGDQRTLCWVSRTIRQDLLVCSPLVILLHETIFPMFVRYKIKGHLDSARTDPIVFTVRMPEGDVRLAQRLSVT